MEGTFFLSLVRSCGALFYFYPPRLLGNFDAGTDMPLTPSRRSILFLEWPCGWVEGFSKGSSWCVDVRGVCISLSSRFDSIFDLYITNEAAFVHVIFAKLFFVVACDERILI